MVELREAITPAYLKMGLFGDTGTGKTFTAAKVLSQFIAAYLPGKQLAMYDSEGGAGYIAPMVQEITGKPLLVIVSQNFPELVEFAALVREKGYVALVDSVTHPWQSLMSEYLAAKRSRAKAAGVGRADSVSLSMQDWGPIKDMWAKFSDCVRYDPTHWCVCGRESDVWDQIEDDEGKKKLTKTGVKMKTEKGLGYEPSILVRMRLDYDKHIAFVVKDRFDVMTGASKSDPDIEFFLPHLDMLDLGGEVAAPNPDAAPAFEPGHGPNYATIQARRMAILETIKNDLTLHIPGMSAADKGQKIELLRKCFGTASWIMLEKEEKQFTADALAEGRQALLVRLKEMKSSTRKEDGHYIGSKEDGEQDA